MDRIATVEAIPVSYPEPNDFNALRHLCLVKITTQRRRRRLGRVDHPVPRGELRDQGDHRGHGRAGRRQGPAREHRDLARDQGQEVVVRLPRRHRQLRDQRHRHGAVGHQGQAPRHQRAQPARRPRPREAAGRSPRATRTTRTSGRWSRRPRSGSRPGCTASRSGSASAATRASATSTTATSSTCAGCARASGPTQMLMIDCGWNVKWDVMTAVRRVQAFEEYDLHWIEEPLGAWDPEGYANLRGKTTTPHRLRREGVGPRGLRAGPRDRHRRRRRHRPRPRGGHHRLQEGDRADRVLPAPVQRPRLVVSAICSAASLAISFSTPSAKLFELKPLRNPMQHELVTEPFEHVDGWVYPPTRPGPGHRGDRGGRRPLPQREGPGRPGDGRRHGVVHGRGGKP